MVKKSAVINLVKTDKNQTLNQIINWALGIGRVLIIIVEVIALFAFLYRFILDSQIRDINDKIKQEQTVISQQKKNEDLYRNIQDRLSIASTFANQASGNTKTFKDILSFAPQGLTFTNVSLSDVGLKIGVSVNSVYPLANFVNSLKNYSKIDTVSIDKIENKTANAVIDVSISVILKKEGGSNVSN